MNNDYSLADAVEADDTTDAALGTVPDVSTEAADFDIVSWLTGGRKTRRAVAINLRGDLIGRLEHIVELLEDDADNADELVDEAEAIQAQLKDSRRVFVVEGRSQEWIENFRETTAKHRGLKVGARSGNPAHRIEVLLAQLADQIVTPKGVTPAHLKQIRDLSEPELKKLLVAMEMANTQAAETASVVTADFSQRRSGDISG